MSDRDNKNSAWRVAPSQYLQRRPVQYGVSKTPVSSYIDMRDGCRLAADIYVPEGAAAGQRFPALLIFTPYYRRFEADATAAEGAPSAARYRDFFVPRGYVVVMVDVRGTGASFGMRDVMRSPTERDDYGQVAEWAVQQPWSDGVIGSTGVSYVGAAACFLASHGHPAVKAIAPLFSVSDIYAEQLYPGGLLSKTWTGPYDRLMLAMDQDRRDLITEFSYYQVPGLHGPKAVDADADGSLLAAAIEEHKNSFRMPDSAGEFAFRDEGMLHEPTLTLGTCSPYYYLDRTPREVPIYSVSGWFDGAGYSNGAITRLLSRDNPDDRLLLGAWDHGARTHVSPWREETAPQFDLLAELLRFFDAHLMGLDTGLQDESPIHYFDMHVEQWRNTPVWPPVAETVTLQADTQGGLVRSAAAVTATRRYQTHFQTSTGHHTRLERLGAAGIVDYYPDWTERNALMCSFDGAVLDAPLALAGHPVLTLKMAVDQGDASIFAYLSEVAADGRVYYMTEGILRAIHRKTSPAPANYKTVWPFRSYARADARVLEKGVVTEFVIPLLPLAWTLSAGSRLRLSIAGADVDHYPAMPYGRPPVFDIVLGADGLQLALPVRHGE